VLPCSFCSLYNNYKYKIHRYSCFYIRYDAACTARDFGSFVRFDGLCFYLIS
jgi:hypothetical protein